MKTAVVIGGGIAGLATARVLAPHFSKVTVYDKNEVKQSLHQHVLLKSGQNILEKLFPGISQKFMDAGCPQIDWANDTLWENIEGEFPRYPSSIKTLSMSRVLLQSYIKAEIESLINVHILDERVENLSDLDASLIVMAGGQSFPVNKYFENFYSHEEKLTINLTYRSYLFNLDDLNMDDFKQYYFQIDPPRSFIGGVICPIENNKAMVTLIIKEDKISVCDTYEDFLLKVRLIPGGVFYKIIQNAQPLSKMAVFRKIETHRRILDVNKIPKGVIFAGDILNSLNPVFGQGMTLSLMQVEALEKMFLDHNFNEKDFHIQCNKLGRIPYLLSKTGSEESGVLKSILRLYLIICQKAKPVHHYFLKILHTLGSPGKLA